MTQTYGGYELLVTASDVVAYLRDAGLVERIAGPSASGSASGGDSGSDAIEVREVTAGNMNRVFIARGPLGSLAVKQAPPWVQVVGPDWPVDPSRIASEARTYERLADRVPESIPTIVRFDEARYVLVMEDLSDLDVLRDALVREVSDAAESGIDYNALGEVVGRFVGELAASTSLRALGEDAHDALVETAANPELCRMTVDVVLDEPYRDDDHNHWHPAIDERVRALRSDDAVLSAVADIRRVFDESREALIHGDLHTGSVMVGRRGGAQAVKVFDPEFSFVGPIGMDLGLFWANMEIAAIAADAVGRADLARARLSAIVASRASFAAAWGDPSTLEAIERDAWGFAGVEMMRRAAGFSHAADIESLPPDVLGGAAIRLFDTARQHILQRTSGLSDIQESS